MKIFAIGAHADDVELGCGGSLLKWADEGHQIVIHVVTDSAYSDPTGKLIRSKEAAKSEAEAAADILGAQLIIGNFACFDISSETASLGTSLTGLIGVEQPDVVLTHWIGDSHADHRAIAFATRHAARRVPTVLEYRSNWYPGSQPFDARVVVDISETLEGKVELIRLFRSENKRTGGVWEGQVRAEAMSTGFPHNLAAAESFSPVSVRL